MATVLPNSAKLTVGQPQGAYYTVSIDCSSYGDSADTNGGRISPVSAWDFTTPPTTLDDARMIARAQLRWKKMLEVLQVRSNFKVVNIVTNYSSSAGDAPILTLAFGLVFENDDFVPTYGSNVDGSTTITKSMYIRDKISEVLNGSFSETMTVYNPTSPSGQVTEIVAADTVDSNLTRLVNSITVAEVSGYRVNISSEVPAEGSGLAATAE